MGGVCMERCDTLFSINLYALFVRDEHSCSEIVIRSVGALRFRIQYFRYHVSIIHPGCIIHYYLLCDRVLVHLPCCRTIVQCFDAVISFVCFFFLQIWPIIMSNRLHILRNKRYSGWIKVKVILSSEFEAEIRYECLLSKKKINIYFKNDAKTLNT